MKHKIHLIKNFLDTENLEDKPGIYGVLYWHDYVPGLYITKFGISRTNVFSAIKKARTRFEEDNYASISSELSWYCILHPKIAGAAITAIKIVWTKTKEDLEFVIGSENEEILGDYSLDIASFITEKYLPLLR